MMKIIPRPSTTLAFAWLVLFMGVNSIDISPVESLPESTVVTTPHLKTKFVIDLRIINRIYHDSLNDQESEEYKSLKKEVEQLFLDVYGPTSMEYLGTDQVTFRNGSVIVSAQLLFGTTTIDPVLGSLFLSTYKQLPSLTLEIDLDHAASMNSVDIFAEEPSTETTVVTTLHPESAVHVEITITNRIYNATLDDQGSADYVALRQEVDHLFLDIYDQSPPVHYIKTDQVTFRSGSVIASADLLFGTYNVNKILLESLFQDKYQKLQSPQLNISNITISEPFSPPPLENTTTLASTTHLTSTHSPTHHTTLTTSTTVETTTHSLQSFTTVNPTTTPFKTTMHLNTTSSTHHSTSIPSSTHHSITSSPHNSTSIPSSTHHSTSITSSHHHSITSSPHHSTSITSSPHHSTSITSSPHHSITSSPHNSTSVTSSPHHITNITSSTHHITNITSIPHNSTNITSSPHHITNITSSPHNDTSITSSSHHITNITSSPHNNTSITSSSHKDTSITSSPHNSTSITSSPHNDTSITSSPHNDTNTTSSPHNDTSITSSPHNSTSITSSPHSTTTPPNATLPSPIHNITNRTSTISSRSTASPAEAGALVPGWGIALLVLVAISLLLLIILLIILLVMCCCWPNKTTVVKEPEVITPPVYFNPDIPMYSTHSTIESPNGKQVDIRDKPPKNRTGMYVVNQ